MKTNPSFPPHSTPWSRLWLVALLAHALLLPTTHAQRMPQDSWYLAKEFRGDIEGGKLNAPRSASADRFGNIYVADDSNHQVQVFDPEGNFLRKWGGYGTATGMFARPHGIHVSSDDKVYVAEYDGDRVQVFDLNGKYIRTVGQTGTGDGQLAGAVDVTTDSAGNIYVADHDLHRIMVFTPQGTYLRQWGSNGSGDGQFNVPCSLCRLPEDRIAVADRSNNRVQIFNSDGTFLTKFGSYGSAAGQFHTPWGIRADSAGNLYVAQHGWDKVQVFSSNFTHVRTIGAEGAGNGQFQDPYGPAIANGKVYIPSASNHRFNVFSETNGAWIQNFGSFGNREFQDTHGIAVDAQGNIFISDHQKNEIRKFDSNYNFIKRFGSSGSGDGQFNGVLEMAIGPNQRLYVVDHSGHRVQYFDLEGNFLGKFGSNGSGDGNFKSPWGIAVGKDNKVYVADRDNHRVQIFDENGVFLGKFGMQGSFDGQFQSPYGLAFSPNGNLAVADSGNERIQIFDKEGNYFKKFSWPKGHYTWLGGRANRLSYSSDGLLYASGNLDYHWERIRVYTSDGTIIKEWDRSWSPMAETKSGDLIAAHGDRVVRVWKRTFRTIHPEPANALPLPTIVSQKRRPGTALVDVDYTVKDADNATVQTAALAFKNGGNSLADVIPITSFADGTANKLGPNIATGETHRFTWDVSRDWSTDFGEVQLEILAKDSRALLNLDFIQIPETEGQSLLKISRSPLNDTDFLSVWYWLLGAGNDGVRLDNGEIFSNATNLEYDGTYDVPGLVANYYYGNTSFSGNASTQIDLAVNILTTPSTGNMSVRWTGTLVPQETGSHRIYLKADHSAKVFINNSQRISITSNGTAPAESYSDITLTAGTPVAIKVEYTDNGGSRLVEMTWQLPSGVRRALTSPYLFTGVQGQSGSIPLNARLAYGTTTTAAGRKFIFDSMGLREATAEEVLRAREAGTPGVINQWEPKLKVGPDERPSKINAYGFDTGGSGYWVVPVTENN